MLELAHRLLEGVALDSDKIVDRNPNIGEVDLTEVPVGGHVGDGADLDALGIHGHDDLGNALVGRAIGGRATDEVAVVGNVTEARPDLLAVDDPLVTVAFGRCLERREVGAGVRFAHADAPGRFAEQHLRAGTRPAGLRSRRR